MAAKKLSTSVLLVVVSAMLMVDVAMAGSSSCYKRPPKHGSIKHPKHPKKPPPSTPPPTIKPPSTPAVPPPSTPKPPKPPSPTPPATTKPPFIPAVPPPSTPKPPKTPPPAPPAATPTKPTPPLPPPAPTCPVDIVKLGVCVPLLGGILGNPAQSNCCALLGLIGLDVEVCLCAAINANVLGIININISKLDVIAQIITTCGQKVPPNLSCP